MPIIGVIASSIAKTTYTPTGSFDALASYTVGSGGASSVIFTGLPIDGTYKHLQLRYWFPSTPTAGDNINLQVGFSSLDTGSNYSWIRLVGYGSGSTSGDKVGSDNKIVLAYENITEAAAYPAFGIVDILDYNNTNKYKNLKSKNGRDANNNTSAWTMLNLQAGSWRSTNPISTVKIWYGGGNLPQNSKVDIYGIRG